MPEIMEIEADENLNNLNSLRISSLEEDGEEGSNEEIEEDEEDDDEVDNLVPVTLGFVEKPKYRCSLLRHLFPSKAGGVPAWLEPVDLPSERSCVCDICREPLQFLLQVYAPLSEKEPTFHRTLFVFMCPSMSCLLQDQHEQWKQRPEKPSRRVKAFDLSYLAGIPSTQVNLQNIMVLIAHLEMELHFVVGVGHGKEKRFAVVAEERAIAQINTRFCIGDQDIMLIVDGYNIF